nr:hypothetical protein [Tanacetum cinerariifolium]
MDKRQEKFKADGSKIPKRSQVFNTLRTDLFLRFFPKLKHVHLDCLLWSDLRAFPTHGEFFPLMTTSSANNSVFRGFFEKQKLTGPNFIDWYRQLRIILSIEDKLNYLEQPIPPAPLALEGQQVAPEIIAAHTAWIKGSKEIVGLMIMTMEPEIQRNMENHHAHKMLLELKTLFAQQAEQELLQTTRDFNFCKQEEGRSVSSYVLKMKGYIDNLERLGYPVTLGLGVKSRKLTSIKNRNPKWLLEDKIIGKGKNKLAYAPKPKIPPPPKREDPVKDSIYHECGETGYWKRNYLQYLSELLKKKKPSQGASNSDGFINRFVNNTIQISRNNMVYFNVIPRDGIFEIDLSNFYSNDSFMYAISNKRAKLDLDSALLWHCRLEHVSKKRIEKLQHDGLLNSTDLKAFDKCVSCMSGKMARKPYTHQVERANDLLGLIHTDVCGPFKIMSRQGASYFVTFSNDFCHYGYVYLLKHEHEGFETFKVFQKEVENQLGKTIKSLCFDREGEYMSQEFLDHLKDHGIITHRTPSYTPQHNGVPERRNKTLLDMVRSMLSQTTLPKSFYDYTLETAARILNMVLTKKALVKRDTLIKPDKLKPKSIKCIFLGYPKKTIGYYFYYPPENKVLVARNVEFLENSLITQEASRSLEDIEIIQEEDTHPSIGTILNHEEDDQEINEPQSDINPIHRSTRTRRPTDRMCLYIDAEEHELGDLGEPANYKAALLDPESDKWLNAMNVEMKSMKDNEVWDLVELPPNGKTVGSKWLFKKKTDMDGAVYTSKARLDYEIWQIDVKTVFLNGYLSEEVYMEQPEGFVNPKYPNRVCKIKRSIYELKCFAMKDLGEAAYIFGINIHRDKSRRLIGLCQSAYIEKILKRYHMENSKRRNIPIQEKLRLSKSQGVSTPAELKRMQNVPYASAMGSIMYDVRCTRPDVAFAPNITSRFQQNLGDLHWTTVKNILKYLKNTKDMFLVYGGDIKRELRVSCPPWHLLFD